MNGTFGVIRLVVQGDRPAPAPVGVVETLNEACDADGLPRWQADLKPGQPVRLLTGPFADLVGELESMTDTRRVRILLDILGGETPVVLPVTSVAPDSG